MSGWTNEQTAHSCSWVKWDKSLTSLLRTGPGLQHPPPSSQVPLAPAPPARCPHASSSASQPRSHAPHRVLPHPWASPPRTSWFPGSELGPEAAWVPAGPGKGAINGSSAWHCTASGHHVWGLRPPVGMHTATNTAQHSSRPEGPALAPSQGGRSLSGTQGPQEDASRKPPPLPGVQLPGNSVPETQATHPSQPCTSGPKMEAGGRFQAEIHQKLKPAAAAHASPTAPGETGLFRSTRQCWDPPGPEPPPPPGNTASVPTVTTGDRS